MTGNGTNRVPIPGIAYCPSSSILKFTSEPEHVANEDASRRSERPQKPTNQNCDCRSNQPTSKNKTAAVAVNGVLAQRPQEMRTILPSSSQVGHKDNQMKQATLVAL